MASIASTSSNQTSRRAFIGGAAALGAGMGISGMGLTALAQEASTEDAATEDAAADVKDAAGEGYFYGSTGELGGASMDLALLRSWLDDHRNYGAAAYEAYLPGVENAPTDEELKAILQIGNSYQWCHALTGVHFVVVRDPAEQQEIILQLMACDTTGMVSVLMLADGCKDQEYHEAQYNERTDAVQYWQMHYALAELGQAQAYMNLAACTFGNRVHNFGAIALPNISYEAGMGDQGASPVWACGGNFDIIRADNWDIAKYCHAKDDEGKTFKHFVMANGEEIELDGNLTLVFACTIGRIDEDLVNTAVTDLRATKAYMPEVEDLSKVRYNYDFWDAGIDGLAGEYATYEGFEEQAAYIEENELLWQTVDPAGEGFDRKMEEQDSKMTGDTSK